MLSCIIGGIVKIGLFVVDISEVKWLTLKMIKAVLVGRGKLSVTELKAKAKIE